MIDVDETLIMYADKYSSTFGCPLPLRMLPQSMSNSELYGLIDECVNSGKNDLVERFIKIEDDILL